MASQKRHAVLGPLHCGPDQRPRFRDAFQHRGLSRRHYAISEFLGCRRAPIPDLRLIGLHRTKMRRRYADSNWSYQRGHRSKLDQQPAYLMVTMDGSRASFVVHYSALRGELVEKKTQCSRETKSAFRGGKAWVEARSANIAAKSLEGMVDALGLEPRTR